MCGYMVGKTWKVQWIALAREGALLQAKAASYSDYTISCRGEKGSIALVGSKTPPLMFRSALFFYGANRASTITFVRAAIVFGELYGDHSNVALDTCVQFYTGQIWHTGRAVFDFHTLRWPVLVCTIRPQVVPPPLPLEQHSVGNVLRYFATQLVAAQIEDKLSTRLCSVALKLRSLVVYPAPLPAPPPGTDEGGGYRGATHRQSGVVTADTKRNGEKWCRTSAQRTSRIWLFYDYDRCESIASDQHTASLSM